MDADDYSFPELRPRPRPWVTWILLGSTVGMFLLQLYEAHLHHNVDVLGDALAFSPRAWAAHHYWTLLTYAWAHATSIFGSPDLFWLHLVAIMIPLFCLGPALEEFLGHARFLGLYLGCALAAALVWFLFDRSSFYSGQGIIGASGAVFGLIAAAGTAAPRARVVVYLFFVLPLRMNLGVLAVAACGAELAQLIFGWLPQVAHTAHLGGAAFGLLYILVLRFLSRGQRVRY